MQILQHMRTQQHRFLALRVALFDAPRALLGQFVETRVEAFACLRNKRPTQLFEARAEDFCPLRICCCSREISLSVRLSPVCGVSTKPSALSKVAATAGALFGSFLLFCERKMASRQAVARNSAKTEIRIFPQRFLAALPTRCLQVSIFCVRRALRRNAATGCSHDEKFFDSGRNCFEALAPGLAALSAVRIKIRP